MDGLSDLNMGVSYLSTEQLIVGYPKCAFSMLKHHKINYLSLKQIIGDNKKPGKPGFLKVCKTINVLRTVDAYALYVDPLSYAQPDVRHV